MVLLFLAGAGFLIWWRLSKPSSNPPSICQQNCKPPSTIYTQGNDCVCVPKMTELDPSVLKPTFPLYLVDFEYDRQFPAGPWCVPTSYAYCYVSTDGSGRYGPMSDWTSSFSISSGISSFPCPPGGCTFSTDNFCKLNKPTLGTEGADYSLGDGYIPMLYRKTELFGIEPVGLLAPDQRNPGPKPSFSMLDYSASHVQQADMCKCTSP